MSYDDPDNDLWDDDPWEGVERRPEEPQCLAPGCYDSGSDWRGRRCRMCNPTLWQHLRARWLWRSTGPWRWMCRKVRASTRPEETDNNIPPF